MYFESARLPLLLLGIYVTVGSAVPVGDSAVSKRQASEKWCGVWYTVCNAVKWVEADQICSADIDPTGTCTCPTNGPVECPVTDPTWTPDQLKKRSMPNETTLVGAEVEATALVRRDHTYITTTRPLVNAIQIIGLNVLQASVTNIIVNKLGEELERERLVMGLAGALSQAITYKGIAAPQGFSAPLGAPFTVRWDWDPDNGPHVNLDIGKPRLLSVMFKLDDGPMKNSAYFNDTVGTLTQQTDWTPIYNKMWPKVSGSIDWDHTMSMDDAITALGMTRGQVIGRIMYFWTNQYNVGLGDIPVVAPPGGGGGRHD